MSEVERKVRVAVIGATGYSGQELIRLLSHHPQVELTYLAGSQEGDRDLLETFPHLIGSPDLRIRQFRLNECVEKSDAVFVALPSGASGQVAADLWRQGKVVIDLSGDLRLPRDLYHEWYGKPAVADDVMDNAVYGLTEWRRAELHSATLVANPGCYATAALTALLPLVKYGLVQTDLPIVIDAKSGVSGAGRQASLGNQLAELGENFYAYRVGRHQHVPEIEQELNHHSKAQDGLAKILLTTQLLPMIRGIYASCYVSLQAGVKTSEIFEAYQSLYESERFVQVLPLGKVPQLKQVRGSNQCFLGLAMDERTGLLQVFSALDNLQKGAAGQAVQNFNLLYHLDEQMGLTQMPLFP